MGGIINAYLDCVSPYSYFALLHLRNHRAVLATHGIEIEIIPVFLGGINVGSGNTPPWTLPAKAKYSEYDRRRATRYFGVPDFTAPDFFPILSLLPQRAITYIKATYDRERFETTFLLLWQHLFYKHRDISKPEILGQLLSEDAHFSPSEVQTILAAANEKRWKDALLGRTKEALERGAFGAPWFWVVNGDGEGAMFFGSDRFHYMWEFLKVPFDDIKLHPQSDGDSNTKDGTNRPPGPKL